MVPLKAQSAHHSPQIVRISLHTRSEHWIFTLLMNRAFETHEQWFIVLAIFSPPQSQPKTLAGNNRCLFPRRRYSADNQRYYSIRCAKFNNRKCNLQQHKLCNQYRNLLKRLSESVCSLILLQPKLWNWSDNSVATRKQTLPIAIDSSYRRYNSYHQQQSLVRPWMNT